jgi:hypothetical protein
MKELQAASSASATDLEALLQSSDMNANEEASLHEEIISAEEEYGKLTAFTPRIF